MSKLDRLQRKLIAARRECQQLRLSLDEPNELARLRNGGRKTRLVIWLLKVCFAINDVFASVLRSDAQDWGPGFAPYQVKAQAPGLQKPYQVFHFIADFVIGGSTQLV